MRTVLSRAISLRLPIATSVRFYSAPPEAIKVYQSDFSKGPFPVEFVSSDEVTYAQFLYKLAEVNKNYDQYLKDFDTLKSLKLPVFWERTKDVTEMEQITKAVSPNFVFFLRWIQTQANLEKIDVVRGYYDTLVNASRKVIVATVYTNAASAADTKLQGEAKAFVQQTLKETPALKDKAAWTVNYKFAVDPSIPAGYYAEFSGYTITNIPQIRSEDVDAGSGEIDYTSVTPIKQIKKTIWEDNVETDVLRKYLDHLALQDEEEQKHGV